MKKLMVGVAAAALVLAVGTASAFARGNAPGWRYTDSDGDGVCDYYAGGQGCRYADEDGDGVCDYYAAGGQGAGAGRSNGGSGAGRHMGWAR